MEIEMQNLLNSKNVVVGFDGFVYTIVHAVEKGMEKNFPEFRQFKTSGTEYSLRQAKVQI
jgi:hypothetical protein